MCGLRGCIGKCLSNTCSNPDHFWVCLFFFSQVLAYFSKTMLNFIQHLYNKHGFTVEESTCWTGLPAVQTFHQMKTSGALWKIMMTNTTKTRDCRATYPLWNNNGTTVLSQKSWTTKLARHIRWYLHIIWINLPVTCTNQINERPHDQLDRLTLAGFPCAFTWKGWR